MDGVLIHTDRFYYLRESLLEGSRKPNSKMLYYKRETRTSRILQPIRQVRVPALMRLNRRIGNPSYGGVRGRG